MSKRAKSAQKEKRKAMKRARKAANKAIYEERKRQGTNSKSFRARKVSKATRRRHKLISHPYGPCGNVGCKRCDPGRIHHV